jgi:hypothetical protein
MEICPVCGSDETEGRSYDPEGHSDLVSQEMYCLVCESQWYNYYKLDRKHLVYSGMLPDDGSLMDLPTEDGSCMDLPTEGASLMDPPDDDPGTHYLPWQ